MTTGSGPGGSVGYGLALARNWAGVLFVAIVTAIVGVVVLVWPDKSLTVLSVLLGIHLLLFGLFRLIEAFSSETASPGLTGFVGVVALLAGVVVVRNPFETITVLAVILAAAWIVIGAIDLMSAITDSSLPDRWLTALFGLVSIVAGIVVISWPEPSVTVIAWIAGLYLLVVGVLLALLAFRLRSIAE